MTPERPTIPAASEGAALPREIPGVTSRLTREVRDPLVAQMRRRVSLDAVTDFSMHMTTGGEENDTFQFTDTHQSGLVTRLVMEIHVTNPARRTLDFDPDNVTRITAHVGEKQVSYSAASREFPFPTGSVHHGNDAEHRSTFDKDHEKVLDEMRSVTQEFLEYYL